MRGTTSSASSERQHRRLVGGSSDLKWKVQEAGDARFVSGGPRIGASGRRGSRAPRGRTSRSSRQTVPTTRADEMVSIVSVGTLLDDRIT
jgi:hypothetical protein